MLCIYPLYVVYLPGREVQLEAQERLHVWWQAREQVEIERVDTAPPHPVSCSSEQCCSSANTAGKSQSCDDEEASGSGPSRKETNLGQLS